MVISTCYYCGKRIEHKTDECGNYEAGYIYDCQEFCSSSCLNAYINEQKSEKLKLTPRSLLFIIIVLAAISGIVDKLRPWLHSVFRDNIVLSSVVMVLGLALLFLISRKFAHGMELRNKILTVISGFFILPFVLFSGTEFVQHGSLFLYIFIGILFVLSIFFIFRFKSIGIFIISMAFLVFLVLENETEFNFVFSIISAFVLTFLCYRDMARVPDWTDGWLNKKYIKQFFSDLFFLPVIVAQVISGYLFIYKGIRLIIDVSLAVK